MTQDQIEWEMSETEQESTPFHCLAELMRKKKKTERVFIVIEKENGIVEIAAGYPEFIFRKDAIDAYVKQRKGLPPAATPEKDPQFGKYLQLEYSDEKIAKATTGACGFLYLMKAKAGYLNESYGDVEADKEIILSLFAANDPECI